MSKAATQDIPVTSDKMAAITPAKAVPALYPLSEMEHLFDRFLGRGWPSLMHWPSAPLLGNLFEEPQLRLPSMDVIDRDSEILVRAEVPGIDKKDLDISITDNLLTIKGQSSSEKKEEKGDYHRREISCSSFARSLALPGAVDTSKAAASMKDGILEITLPKLASSRRRNIAVG